MAIDDNGQVVEGGVDCHAAVDPSHLLDRSGVGCFQECLVINLSKNYFYANAVKKSAKCPKSGYIQYIVKEMKIIKEAKNANFSKVGAVSNAHDVWIFKLGVSSPNI